MTAGAREASLRPFGKPSPRWWLLVGALSTVVLIGITAWVVQLRSGMGVAGYNDHAFWAIYIADVVTFIGVSYGGAVVSAILRLTGATWRAPLTRLAEGTAVVTVLIGAALIIPHIGHPDRLYELVTRPNLSAPVFWDFVAVTTYTFASIVFFALPLVPDMAILSAEHAQHLGRGRRTLYAVVSRGWVGAPRQRRVLAGALGLVSIMIIPLAVSVHSVPHARLGRRQRRQRPFLGDRADPHDRGTVDVFRGRRLGDRHLLTDQLQPDLLLLRRGQEPLRAPPGAVGPTVRFGHHQILREKSKNPSDVV